MLEDNYLDPTYVVSCLPSNDLERDLLFLGVAASDALAALEHADPPALSSEESQERLSSRLPSRLRVFFNLSTRRLWNLLRLPWLPELDGLGGLHPTLVVFVGLISEFWDVREEFRENPRDVLRFIEQFR